MNEPTVKLYQQALEFAYMSIGKEHADTAYFQGAVAGKFAELIVRECAGVDLYWLSEQDRKSVAEKIKQHFGVEE